MKDDIVTGRLASDISREGCAVEVYESPRHLGDRAVGIAVVLGLIAVVVALWFGWV